MELTYIGGDRWVPTWPASDHDEPDEALAAQKLQSGLYVRVVAKKTTTKGDAVSRASESATETNEEASASDA